MARLKEIEVSLGLTLEQKGVYYKPNARIVLEIDLEDSGAKRDKVWEQAWKMVEEQVTKQLENIK